MQVKQHLRKKKRHINKSNYIFSFIFLYLSGMILCFSKLCSKQRYDYPDHSPFCLLPHNFVSKIKKIDTAYLKSDMQNEIAAVYSEAQHCMHTKNKEKVVIYYPNLRCAISKAGMQTLSLLKSLWVYRWMTYLIRS